ncbi:MAG: FAD/NAD(P)-binding oxidoreductase [Gemmatimonadota bacterium]
MTETRVDVAVIGGGPAGIAAAVTAAADGARVVLLDEGLRPGGQIWRHVGREMLPRKAQEWLRRLDASPAEVSTGTSVVDIAGDRLVVQRPSGPAAVRAKSIILATGARELFLPFPGWTLPGVVGVGGAQALLKSGLDVRGMRVVVAGSGPLLFPVAAAFAKGGADVREVLEQTPLTRMLRFGAGLWRTPVRVAEAAAYRRAFAGARLRTGTWVTRAEGSDSVVRAIVTSGRRSREIDCDLLCVGYGLVPSVELARLIGCALDGDGIRVGTGQQTSVPHVYAAGEPTGIGGVDAALVEGQIAGFAATGRDAGPRLLRERLQHDRFRTSLAAAFAPRDALLSLADEDTIVCRCEDVTIGRVAACSSVREAKLTTRAGMGPCQGRVCGPALRHLFDWEMDSVRAPVLPATVATMLEMAESADA